MQEAVSIGRNNLLFPESYFEVRVYNSEQNIIGGINDNGKTLGIFNAKDIDKNQNKNIIIIEDKNENEVIINASTFADCLDKIVKENHLDCSETEWVVETIRRYYYDAEESETQNISEKMNKSFKGHKGR